MFKNDNLIDVYVESRQKIGGMIADLGAKKKLVMQRKEQLQAAFSENLSHPLSKVATVELVARVIDKLASDFRQDFTQKSGRSCMLSVPLGYSSPGDARPLRLDDVASILETGDQWFPDKPHGLHGSITWIAPSPEFLCFFFGEAIKEKLLPLWTGIDAPHADDGQSLAQREQESQRLKDEIAKVDIEIAALDAEIAKWNKVRGAKDAD